VSEPFGGVQVELDDRVMVISIDRPSVRNAVDLAAARRIHEALDRLDSDAAIRVAVLTGTGGTFCAGMDLKAFAAGSLPKTSRGFAGLTHRPPSKPIIAAVEGFAVGGGFELVLACDLVVASEESSFALPEVARGLSAGAGGLIRLPRKLPVNLAMETALTGRSWSGSELARWGVVNAVVPAGEALTAARGMADAVARMAPMAVEVSKRVMLQSAHWPIDEAFDIQEPWIDAVRRSADAQEGARAFAEKRAPIFTGA
jgi:enoyl-CoA hydratase